MVVVMLLSGGTGIVQGGLTVRHEWQIPQGGPGRQPGRAEGGHPEGPERARRGWHDADAMGRLSRQPGGAAADRGQRVGGQAVALKNNNLDLS